MNNRVGWNLSDAMEELEARIRGQVSRICQLGEDLTAIRVRESAPDGTVTVEVDGNGALLDLELSEAISQLSTADFERLLVDTACLAARRAFGRRAELVDTFNEDVAF
jgi:DNA-binding protein YbaB